MAREFNGSSEYLNVDQPVVDALPFTFSAWANADNTTANHTLLCVADKDVPNKFCMLRLDGAAGGAGGRCV